MPTRLAFVCLAVFVLLVLAPASRAGEEGPPVLRSTGVGEGVPESLLPAGAIVHVRAHSPLALIKSLDQFILSFVPEKALAPGQQLFLKQPLPLLGLLGFHRAGKTMTADEVGQMFGVAPGQPVTVSLYMGEAGPMLMASLPISEPKAFTGLLMNALAPRKFELKRSADVQYFEIVGTNPDLPNPLYVSCSEKRAYISTSLALTKNLTVNVPRLSEASPLISTAMKEHADQDLTVFVDPFVLKRMVATLQDRYPIIPPRTIQQLRMQILRNLPPDQKRQFDLRLRWQYGIDGVEQGLDYLEALATGSYEVLLGYLAGHVKALKGLVVSVDLGHPTQRMRVVLHSDAIKKAACTQPLPMPAVRAALAKLPGPRDWVTMTGRCQPSKTPPVMKAWMDKLKEKFAQKKLPADGLTRYASFLLNYHHAQQLEAQVPWTISASVSPPAVEKTTPPDNVLEYLKSLFTGPQGGTLIVMPAQEKDFIAAHYSKEALGVTTNEKDYRELSDQDYWFNCSARSRVTPVENGLKKLIYETAYTSNFGLFGYSEHELVNRKILYYGQKDNSLFMQQGTTSGDVWVSRLNKLPAQPLSPSLTRMLDRIPADAVSARTVRILHQFPALLDGLGTIENLIHAELDGYLVKVCKILDEEADPAKREAKVLAIEPPLTMMALCSDPATKKPYLLLPGNLRFPRSKVVPAIAQLFKAYTDNADKLGGTLEYERITDGACEMALNFNSDALAFFVKSTVNSFLETYGGPEGRQKLQKILLHPADGRLQRNQVLLYNTLWSFLYEQREPMPPFLHEDL